MRKVIFILVPVLFFTGCALFRNTGKSVTESSEINSASNILQGIKYQNLINKGFFIQRAELEVIYPNGKEKFISNIKFEKPDKYLISFRNKIGIEGARIYISNDTVLINDRINKKLYFAKALYLKKRYGLTPNLFPLIFGDILLDKKCESSEVNCSGKKIELQCSVRGINLNYTIDCGKKKISAVYQWENAVNSGFRMTYEGYFIVGNIKIPRRVIFENAQTGIIVKMKILKIDTSWNGNVKFVPGKGYDLIELI